MVENRDGMIAFCIRAEETAPNTSRSFIKLYGIFLSSLTMPELQEHVERAELMLNVNFITYTDTQMNTTEFTFIGRTTQKFLTVADLLEPDYVDCSDYDDVAVITAVALLINNGHPLPTILVHRDKNGRYHVQSHDGMMRGLSVLIATAHTPAKKRKIKQYTLPAIIVEYVGEDTSDANDVITAYNTVNSWPLF